MRSVLCFVLLLPKRTLSSVVFDIYVGAFCLVLCLIGNDCALCLVLCLNFL